MMNISIEDKEMIRRWALDLGACRCGFAVAEPVDEADAEIYDKWIAEGCHATMGYCAKCGDVRRDPRRLLEGAETVISCAFNYHSDAQPDLIASYALGMDYHYVVKDRLNRLAEAIISKYVGECRAVVDTAPMRERYWSVRAGVGFIGCNGQLIVPGIGSYVFLGHLLWTESVAPDQPCGEHCQECLACVVACPGGALDGTGRCDARRCTSYLTIEHRGDLPPEATIGDMAYGCDICQSVCPHNQHSPLTDMPEFQPRPEITNLAKEDILTMTPSHYKKLIAHSALRRVPLKQLIRNISAHNQPKETNN